MHLGECAVGAGINEKRRRSETKSRAGTVDGVHADTDVDVVTVRHFDKVDIGDVFPDLKGFTDFLYEERGERSVETDVFGLDAEVICGRTPGDRAARRAVGGVAPFDLTENKRLAFARPRYIVFRVDRDEDDTIVVLMGVLSAVFVTLPTCLTTT